MSPWGDLRNGFDKKAPSSRMNGYVSNC